jgi:hypothetical protein
MKRSRAAIGTALVTTTLTSLALLAPPAANAATVSDPIVDGLQGALQIDVTEGAMLVAQNAPVNPADENSPSRGSLGVVEKGSVETLWKKVGVEVSGIARRNKTIAFLTTNFDPDHTRASLMLRKKDGSVKKVANLLAYEKEANPDGGVTYNVRGLTDRCEKKLPPFVKPYQGIVESHPYAIANAPGGGWYVADAAGNSILKVSRKGGVKTVHVARPAIVEVTRRIAKAFDLPGCTIGSKGAFEGVPTDVEVTKSGKLIVSSLPGGPDEPALGANGAVYRVNPETGKAKKLAGGLVGATNVAISDSGDIYVAELFRGRVAKLIGDGETATVAEVGSPAAIEWFQGDLYASIDLFSPSGSIVKITEAS